MGLSEQDRALIVGALVSVGHGPQNATWIAAEPSEYALDDEDLGAIFSAIRAQRGVAHFERVRELEGAVAWSVDAIAHLADTMVSDDYHKRLKKRVAWLRALLPHDKEPSDDR